MKNILNKINKKSQNIIDKNIPDLLIKCGISIHGCYNYNKNNIEINYYSWKKLNNAQKKLLMIHEILHYYGLDHDIEAQYDTYGKLDTISLMMYFKLFGHDDDYIELEKSANALIEEYVHI